MDHRTKVSFSKLNKEIDPYVKRHVFSKDTIEDQKIAPLCAMILHKYNNVQITEGVDTIDGKVHPWLKMEVEGLMSKKELLLYIVKGRKTRKSSSRQKGDWIDEIEDYLAATED